MSRGNPSLTDVARSIRDSAAFLADVRRVAADYADWYQYDRGRQVAASRKALRDFDRLARGLADWLGAALGSDDTPEQRAARKLHAASLEGLRDGHAAMERALAALIELTTMRDRAAELLAGDKAPKSAARLVADQLWVLLPRYGLRVTVYERGSAARLLVAMAREAGDRSITPAAAKKFLGLTRPAEDRNASTAKARRKRT